MTLLSYLSKFEEVFASLNEQQQNAVQHIEGPVLVIAGPGTGKTQILAARIARILLETDIFAENILCLTYTDAGAVAMRQRLREFIGADAYRVNIATFHSFCNQVIQENLDIFGFRNLDPLSDLETIQFLRELIDNLPKSHLLKRYTGDAYYEVFRLQALFALMKKEDWSPSFLLQKVEQYSKDLPLRDEFIYKRSGKTKDGKTYNKGDVKEDALNKALKDMHVLRSAIELYEPYQEILRKNNRYDFADMILWVIRAFREHPGLLADYQEKYQYILVDEFQDTSGSQNDLLKLLYSYWEVPNVFAVGDDDQSIFRFQGANIENIQQFSREFGNTIKLITLKENYRSAQPVLDASRKLINRNIQRVNPDKFLTAANPLRNTPEQIEKGKPHIVAYYNPMHESAHVCQQIKDLHSQGVPLHEIAVLYRNHRQADEMIQFLKAENLEVNSRRRINILQEPLIRKIITVLEYLAAECNKAHTGETYLFEILHYHEFGIPPLLIARMSVELASLNFNERNSSWREELAKKTISKQRELFPEIPEQVGRFSRMIETLISAAQNQTPQETLYQVLRECRFLSAALTHEEQSWQMEMIKTFFDFVKTECMKNPQAGLPELTRTLKLMQENDIPLPAEKVIYSESGVNFITAHSSKGLEFEYVFMIGCESKAWDKSRPGTNYKLPDNIFEIKGDETEDARRLFYVAMTRAKAFLQMSFSEQDMNLKPQEPSRFLAEIMEDGEIKLERIQESPVNLNNYLLKPVLHEKDDVNIPRSLIDTAFTNSLLQKYSLSVTHLNNYLKCPVAFYFNSFIKVPAPKSASLTFGSAVHFALEQLFKKMNADTEKKFPDIAVFLQDFKWFMRRNQDSFTETEYKRRVEYGEEILPHYYEHHIHHWNKITTIERTYKNVLLKGIPLNGKLDKLEFDGNAVNVVDYKTGNYKNAASKFSGPNPEAVSAARADGKKVKFEDEYGGDYWRQAVFYKILMDQDKTKKWEMRSAEFDFVEPQKTAGENGKQAYHFHKEKLIVTREDIETVSSQIQYAYSNIMAKNFSPGCGDHDCHWCNFTRDYYQVNPDALNGEVSLPEEADEQTD